MFDTDGDVNRPHLFLFFLKYLAAGVAVTIFFALAASYLSNLGWSRGFEQTFYFLPWAAVLVLGIAAAFHKGARDEYVEATGFRNAEDAAGNDLNLPYPSATLEDWEREAIFPYTLKLIVYSAIGSLAFYGFVSIGGWTHNALFHPFILFAPWIVALSFGIAEAYMMGVSINRRRLRGRRDVDRRNGPRRKVERPGAQAATKPAPPRPLPAESAGKRKVGRVAPRKPIKKS